MNNMKSAGLLFISGLAITLAFQNCGSPFSVEKELSSLSKLERDTTFDYPYATKPDFYSDMALYRNESAIDSLSEFTFLGSAVFIEDPTQTVTYTVTVKSAEGALLCPTQSGSLVSGVTAIEFDCTAPVTNQHARVALTVAAAGKTATFEQAY